MIDFDKMVLSKAHIASTGIFVQSLINIDQAILNE